MIYGLVCYGNLCIARVCDEWWCIVCEGSLHTDAVLQLMIVRFRRSIFDSYWWLIASFFLQVISPVNCVRRGWTNIEPDVITCEACGARLLFSTPSSWTTQQGACIFCCVNLCQIIWNYESMTKDSNSCVLLLLDMKYTVYTLLCRLYVNKFYVLNVSVMMIYWMIIIHIPF